MVALRVRRWATGVVMVLWGVMALTSILANWPSWSLIAIVVGGLACVSVLSHRPSSGRSGQPELYASDAYSDAYLGRTRATHPYPDPQPTSQVGDPPAGDPLGLPEKPEGGYPER